MIRGTGEEDLAFARVVRFSTAPEANRTLLVTF